jgi:hypothetical protein
MAPAELRTEQFQAYPPLARKLVAAHIELLRKLPSSFVALLLREVIAYDWKFPAERAELDRQFTYLESLSPDQLRQAMDGFARLRLTPDLERVNWVDSPGQFSEQFTAHLWATHQIDLFRATAVDYVDKFNGTAPQESLPAPRLGIVLVGRGVTKSAHPLFRKLRPHGVYFKNVKFETAYDSILDAVRSRALEHPSPYAHWYIEGGAADPGAGDGLTFISYAALTPVRAQLQSIIQKSFESGMGSEALRTSLAKTRPEDIGFKSNAGDGVLTHFQLSLLTEGSGTQIFSTTFVQWAAREALRRAQPLTLLARFAPRQREQSMKELLTEAGRQPALDPEGSLIDADMGAYYTWLNQQKLAEADKSGFLVWFEGHPDALVISRLLPRGTESDAPIEMADLIRKIA